MGQRLLLAFFVSLTTVWFVWDSKDVVYDAIQNISYEYDHAEDKNGRKESTPNNGITCFTSDLCDSSRIKGRHDGSY